MAHCLIRLSAISLLFAALAPAWAQTELSDPTRPPAGISSDAADAEQAASPVLQSVLIPNKGKPAAIIGGQQVLLGEKYGKSRLIRLTEREAVLEGPAGIERLLLTPGVEKTNITIKSPVTGRVQRGSKP